MNPLLASLAVDLVATLIGAALGFALAMKADRHRKAAEETDRKRRTIESLIGELERTRQTLDVPEVEMVPQEGGGGVALSIQYPTLLTSAFDAAVHSGNLTLLSPDLQVDLSAQYELVRIARKAVDIVATFYEKALEFEQELAHLDKSMAHLKAQCAGLEEGLDELLAGLRRELPAGPAATSPAAAPDPA